MKNTGGRKKSNQPRVFCLLFECFALNIDDTDEYRILALGRFVKAVNTLSARGTQTVLNKINTYKSLTNVNPNLLSQEKQIANRREQLIAQKEALLAIRGDLGISPKDDPKKFNFTLEVQNLNKRKPGSRTEEGSRAIIVDPVGGESVTLSAIP